MMKLIEFVLARLTPSAAAGATRPCPEHPRTVSVDGPAQGPGPVPRSCVGGRGLVVPAPVLQRDEPHAGDPSLERWPVSLAEAELAAGCIAGEDLFVELVEVCGSAARATAVLGRIRYEQRMAGVAVRAFGVVDTAGSAAGHHALGSPSYPRRFVA